MAKAPTGQPHGRPRLTNNIHALHGTLRPHRMRDEPTTADLGGPPELPPGTDLDPEERAVFDWYAAHAAVLQHGTIDGELLAQLARVTVQCRQAESKVREFGPVMRGSSGNAPAEQPYSKLARRLRGEIRSLWVALALPPIWRLKLAPTGRTIDGESDWADID